MKKIFLYILLLASVQADAQSLSGRVFDSDTKEGIPGASVTITDLKIGAITDVKGHYIIQNLPKGRFRVQVKSIGHTTVVATLNLAITTEKDFALKPTVIEAPEVVVTGSAFTSEQTQTSVSVVPIEKIQITTVGADNIISALASIPGLASINTGGALSKPVIRGLGYNRIIVVNEGVRQEGQQWGDEHGVEIDEFSADKIEVLKGPSSLLYGSDAMGGVINILEPIPVQDGEIQGELNSNYSTNNGLTANSLMLEGNQNGFVWRARGTYKNAHGYETPAERIWNSGFNEQNGEALLGLNRSWGYSHLHYSRWDSQIGFIEGERDSITGKLLNEEGNIATDAESKSRDINLPFQKVLHNKFSLVNNFIIRRSQLRLNGGFQQNDRKEFEAPDADPSLWFHLNTVTYDVKYYFPYDSARNIETVIGGGGMTQQNENKGEEFLIPDYSLFDAGFFASIKKTFKKATLNAGMRYDIRNIDGDELMEDSTELFAQFNSEFSAISGSIGATYQVNEAWNIKGNIGRGFRAPNISELSANGVHEGTFRYEAGNPDLDPETSLQFDLSIAAEWKKLGFSLDGFYNIIDNFIYYRHFSDSISIDNELLPVYRYVQGNSVLKGFEFSFDVHPVSNLHFENSISYVDAENFDISRPLPFIPPIRITDELRYTFKTKKESHIQEPYIKLTMVNALKQDRIDIFETATDGYTLFNAGAGMNIIIGKQKALVFVNANNITDTKYFNHLSRLKEVGIHEMGRNITFGLSLPFGLK
jgi:iron complex outermembrane recepter protein